MTATRLLQAMARAHAQRVRRRPMEHVLSSLLAALLDAFDAPAGAIGRLEPGDDGQPRLRVLAEVDGVPARAPGRSRALDGCLASAAAAGAARVHRGEPVVAAPGLRPSALGAAFPIAFDGDVVGVLALSGAEVHLTAELAAVLDVCGGWIEEDAVEQGRRRAQRRLEASEARSRAVISGALDGVLLVGDDGRVREANPAAARMFGYEPDELVGCSVERVLPREGVELAPGRHLGFARLRDGEAMPLDAAIHRVRCEGEELTAVVFRDTRAQRRSEDELQRLNEELRARVGELARLNRENQLLAQLGSFLQACHDPDDVARVVGRFLPELFEGSMGTFSGLHGRLLEQEVAWGGGNGPGVFTPDDCWALRRGEIHVARGSRDLRCGHLEGCTHGHHDSFCVPVMTGDGPVGLMHVLVPDAMTEETRKSTQRMLGAVADRLGAALTNLRLRERLREESIRDPLTRLFNRRYMVETMQREIVRSKRAGQPLAVVMIDVDHFKKLNDRHGHDVGDQVLQAVSAELAAGIRAEDVVCRYGGEEFVAILPGASLELAVSRADELRARLQSLRVQARGAVLTGVTVSAGVAVAMDGTPEALLRAADRALLQAKQSGRDRVCVSLADGRVEAAA